MAQQNQYLRRGRIVAVSDACVCKALEPDAEVLYATQGSVDVTVDGVALKLVREGATFGVMTLGV